MQMHYKSQRKWSCFKRMWKDIKGITENMSFSIDDYAFKTNWILTIECRLMAPEGPPGSPREPPDPPALSTCTIKVKWNGHVSGSVWKDIKNITKKMTCSISNYAFKTNEILTIWCHIRAPQAKFEAFILSVAVQWIALFHFVVHFWL